MGSRLTRLKPRSGFCAETAAALRSLRDATPFPHADLRLAWRDLLRNHPHDSICGCSCDEVHRDMLVRYEQLDRTLDYAEREALGVGGALVNTLPYPRRRVVDGVLLELDGFCGRRSGPLVAGENQLEPEAIAELLVFEDEPDIGDLYTFCPSDPSGKTTSAQLVGSRRDGDVLVAWKRGADGGRRAVGRRSLTRPPTRRFVILSTAS